MRKLYWILLPTLIALIGGACWIYINSGDVFGSGTPMTDKRDVTIFNRIHLNGNGNLIIQQGDNVGLSIEAEDNLINHITSDVVDGTLHIHPKTLLFQGEIKPTLPINYVVTVTELEEVVLSGSGIIYCEKPLRTQHLNVSLYGSGRSEMNLAVESLVATLSGSGKFSMRGEAKEQQINIIGSARYTAPQLVSKKANINISGYGKVTVQANKELDVEISGTGLVSYIGNPKVTQNISGSGLVEQISRKKR